MSAAINETIYEIALDKNGDGFICLDAKPDDALNLVPGAVRYDALPFFAQDVFISLPWDDTPYGIRRVDITLVNNVTNALFAGRRSGGAVDVMPVQAGKTYTAGVWIRGATNFAGMTLGWAVVNQALTELASVTFEPGAEWTRVTVTFTAGAGDSHVALALTRASNPALTIIAAAGFMLTEGDSLPDGFNSGDPRDLDDFITADVIEARWRLGMERPYDRVAATTQGAIMLDDPGGTYAPERSDIVLAPGTRVHIRARQDETTHVLLDARVDHVRVEAGDEGGRRAIIRLEGIEARLAAMRVLIPLLTNARADDVINAVLANPPLNRIPRMFEAGQSVFAYAGDTWRDGITARGAIIQVTEAERGRFYTDRKGHLRFRDRRHLLALWTVDAWLADSVDGLEYVYGEHLANRIRVTVRPRALGSAGATIWTLAHPQRIPAGACREITARLRDDNDNPMGALDVVTPAAGTDYTANTQADGGGTNVTAQVSVSIAQGTPAGSAIRLEVCNHSGATAWLLPGSRLRGTALIQADPMLIEARDDASIDQHGLYPLEYDLPYFVTIDEADELAQTTLAARRIPVGAARTVTLINRANQALILARTLFDVVRIGEGKTGHDADYAIIAEEHHIDAGGARHRCRWLLEPLNPRGFWQLGRGELGLTTRLSYPR